MNHFQSADSGEAAELAAVSEALRGNPQAFRLIVDRYKDLLYRLSFSFLGNREDAEESTQDILMRAFRYLHRFSLQKRFLPWLYGIALNHLRTAYSKHRRRQARRLLWESSPADVPSADPQQILAIAQDREEIRAAVASLPRTLREPMLLHYFQELSVETIAAILEIGEEGVKSRLLRGRRRLKGMLGEGATPPSAG